MHYAQPKAERRLVSFRTVHDVATEKPVHRIDLKAEPLRTRRQGIREKVSAETELFRSQVVKTITEEVK
jgi:hypothetical protein